MAVLLAITLFIFCFLGFIVFTGFCNWIISHKDLT